MVIEGSKQRRALLALIAFPVVIFYGFLCALALNLPLYDDYDAGLAFSTQMKLLPGGAARWLHLAEAQQNEYKIYLGHAFVWLELTVLGHVNFRLLCFAGDLFVLLLLWVLWKMFLPTEQDKVRRLALFLPVPFLIAQLGYWETLNWPLPGLQNIPILGFSLGGIYLLGKGTNRAWWGAAAAMVLAIAASGNGFLLLPIGCLMLLVSRRWVELAGWVATAAAAIWVYSYHYTTVTQKAGHGSMITALLHPKLVMILAFMGAAGSYPVRAGAYPVGLAIACFLVWMVVRGYPRRNPVVCYCVLFCLLTAVAVAGIRADGGGLVAGTASRYRMYSDLLLAFCWYAAAEEFLLDAAVPLGRNFIYRTALVVAVLFWAGNTRAGALTLRLRNGWMTHGMALYEHPDLPRVGQDGPVFVAPHDDAEPWGRFEVQARRVLDKARAAGVYEPPAY